MSWHTANEILVAAGSGFRLDSVDISTGSIRNIVGVTDDCSLPAVIPNDLGVVCGKGSNPQHLTVLSFQGKKAAEDNRILTSDAQEAKSVAGGHAKLFGNLLIWVTNDGELAAAVFDAKVGTVGASKIVQRGVRRSVTWASAHYDITRSGDLVYVPGSNASVGQFVSKREDQNPRVLPIPPKQHLNFAVSPDGLLLASTAVGLGGAVEMWIYNIASGLGDRVASGFSEGWPMWRPDGKLLFTLTSARGEKPAVLLADPMRGNKLDTLAELPLNPHLFVDAATLVGTLSFNGDQDIEIAYLESTPPTVHRLQLKEDQYYPVVSPDRQWLAYSGAEKGLMSVYVTPFPALDYQLKVSTDGGIEPMFLRDGSLVYRNGTARYRAPKEAGASFGQPRPFWSDRGLLNTSGRSNVDMPDGSILYLQSLAPPTGGYIRVVKGWMDKVRALMQ